MLKMSVIIEKAEDSQIRLWVWAKENTIRQINRKSYVWDSLAEISEEVAGVVPKRKSTERRRRQKLDGEIW